MSAGRLCVCPAANTLLILKHGQAAIVIYLPVPDLHRGYDLQEGEVPISHRSGKRPFHFIRIVYDNIGRSVQFCYERCAFAEVLVTCPRSVAIFKEPIEHFRISVFPAHFVFENRVYHRIDDRTCVVPVVRQLLAVREIIYRLSRVLDKSPPLHE